MLAVLFLVIVVYINYKSVDDMRTIKSGWTVSVDGVKCDKQPGDDLGDYRFPKLTEGQTISLQRKLIKVDDVDLPRIVFYTWHMKTDVYYNNALVYSQGKELLDNEKMLGFQRHEVSLPKNQDSSSLRINLTATGNNSQTYMDSIGLYDINCSNTANFGRIKIFAVIGMFLIGVSFLMLDLILRSYKYLPSVLRDSYLAVGVQLLGIYILARSRMLELFVPNIVACNRFEYLSLYFVPIPFVLFIATGNKLYRENIVRKALRYINITYCVALGAFTLYCLVGYANLNEGFFLFFILRMIIAFLCLAGIYENRDIKVPAWESKFSKGVVVFLSSVFITSFMYCLYLVVPAIHPRMFWRIYSIISVGSLILSIFFLTDGLYEKVRYIAAEITQASVLRYIATTDELTKLNNRNVLDTKRDEYQDKSLDTFNVIMFDLNDLKKTNDTVGHKQGDILLRSFGNILKAISTDTISAYRLGGDEFLVLVEDDTNLEELVAKIQSLCDEFNLGETMFQISFAAGCVKGVEADSTTELMQIADLRMYEDKAKKKQNRYSGVYGLPTNK